MTCFNGNGSEHTWSGYHIPGGYLTKIKKDNSFLVIMDYSKKKLVYTWYNEKTNKTGIRKHVPVLNDNRGLYFMVNGNKIRI